MWKSRWPSWAPVPNKPTVSVDVKQHFSFSNNCLQLFFSRRCFTRPHAHVCISCILFQSFWQVPERNTVVHWSKDSCCVAVWSYETLGSLISLITAALFDSVVPRLSNQISLTPSGTPVLLTKVYCEYVRLYQIIPILISLCGSWDWCWMLFAFKDVWYAFVWQLGK